MAIINVDDAYILNETGAQVDKVTGLFTKDESTTAAEKAFAQLNIGTAGSNRNLLDNPFFTINQRNVANGVHINANGFVADRWQATGTIGATRNSDGSLTIADTLFHKLPTDLELAGKTVTLSVLYADGTTEANTFPWSGTSTKYFTYGRAVVYASAYQINFNSFTKDVKAFKLELGSVSTLANDTPPDYGTELLKCMRYFVRLNYTSVTEPIGYGYVYSASQARILIPTPVPMRANPTISATATANLRINSNGTYLTPSGFTATGTAFPNGIAVHFGISGATSGALALLFSYDAMYIDFSADL